MTLPPWPAVPFWSVITRFGEAQILLPLMVLACAALAWAGQGQRRLWCWPAATVAAATLTTATKVAFIGFGLGWARLDFTGISGHAMFAAAVLPPLGRLAEGALPVRWHGRGLALGVALALLVAVSRVMVQAHSWSEVVAGALLGGAASALVLRLRAVPRLRLHPALPLALGLAALLAVHGAPPSRSHDWVTRLALAASGRSQPFHRHQLHRPQAGPGGAPAGGGLAAAGGSLQLR